MLATIPSLPLSFVRAAHVGAVVGAAGANRGWESVIPASVDPLVLGKTINICRRVEGSGTQATSNVFLALNPCQNGAGAGLTPSGFTQAAGSGSSGGTAGVLGIRDTSTAYSENTSAGNVETCIGTTVENANTLPGATPADPRIPTTQPAYGMAWLGRELNPLANAGDRGYRWVKLSGQAPTRLEAKAGRYDAVFEATMQWNTASPRLTDALEGPGRLAFVAALRNGIGRPASLAALDIDTQQGTMSPPATYSGAYNAIDPITRPADFAFGSRVSRAAGNSCTPLRIVK